MLSYLVFVVGWIFILGVLGFGLNRILADFNKNQFSVENCDYCGNERYVSLGGNSKIACPKCNGKIVH
ncbi:MAG: hypothetical protein PHN19_01870 [Patescibacteria group bacterium]|nr:hypothetical protein [Patescibacteria group bacterium]